ncbi:MAG: CoA transferase [Candidatus Nanopelagicales bacterium]|nr:CoA transferase [Candidatus Nanopelagicales bacterium]
MTFDSFDPCHHLDALLGDVGISRADAECRVSFAGADPILPSRHRLGACVGLPMMAASVAAQAIWRQRGGRGQELLLDLRQAVHALNPHAFWSPTLAGEPLPAPLILDNPFLLTPYRTADARTVMASGVYPHLAAQWCRFLNAPPDFEKVRAAFERWDAVELEDAANEVGLPLCVARTPTEWLDHPQGALLAGQPVVRMERIGDCDPLPFRDGGRPLSGVRVLSFTHAIAGPTVGRTLAEQGADVLCVTRSQDYEHDFIYAEANLGSRSTYLDLNTEKGQAGAQDLLSSADVVVNNHRGDKLEALGLWPEELARRYPGIVTVSVTCYGSTGPWARRGGFDMNGSAASGLMVIEGSEEDPRLPPTGMINDFVTGYLGALGASAALLRRAREGGSWKVQVSLTRAAMWYQTLGLVDPAAAGSDSEHSLREPESYDTDSPLGEVHALAPQVRFSETPPAWPDPVLVPRGSSRPLWLPRGT